MPALELDDEIVMAFADPVEAVEPVAMAEVVIAFDPADAVDVALDLAPADEVEAAMTACALFQPTIAMAPAYDDRGTTDVAMLHCVDTTGVKASVMV